MCNYVMMMMMKGRGKIKPGVGTWPTVVHKHHGDRLKKINSSTKLYLSPQPRWSFPNPERPSAEAVSTTGLTVQKFRRQIATRIKASLRSSDQCFPDFPWLEGEGWNSYPKRTKDRLYNARLWPSG